ncbi:MAG TPA: hypothetical protein QGG47_10865 [Acidobacteriota bacterium]|nr:hypothetical protein [Acidobacteriota bacterium]
MSLIENLKRHFVLYLAALMLGIATAVGVNLAAAHFGVSVKILTRDPYRAAVVPPYYAYASLVGSAAWLISGASTVATAIVGRRALGARFSDDSTYRILVLGGAIGLVMALDDILLFHDAFAEKVGIPEILFHVVYTAAFVALFGLSRTVLARTPWLLLLGALGGFGLSSVIDNVFTLDPGLRDNEDVFKLCAIALWALYFVQVCWQFAGDARRERVHSAAKQ